MDLVVLCGLPASGKSTFRRAHLGDHAVVSKDLMGRAPRKDRRQVREIEAALGAGRSVVVDNTNPAAADRIALARLGRIHGAHLVGYWFESRMEDCRRRNEARGESRVPEVALRDVRRRLEVPTATEGFDQWWYVRLTNEGFDITPWRDEARGQ